MRSVLILTALLFSACGGHSEGSIDDVIGSPCAADRDCDSRCYTDPGDFPGGFCSLSCQTDNDCPGDTYCMTKGGGVCLFACPAFDCTRLGPGWGCHDEDRKNGGKQQVCIGN